MKNELLLLSTSSVYGMGYLEHAFGPIQEFLAGRNTVHFVPYALRDFDEYTSQVRSTLSQFDVSVVGLHTLENPAMAIEEAEILFVGGGNSFRLVKALLHFDLLTPVRKRVRSGAMRYMGSNAGAVMCCPTIRTANDLPIVDPPTLDSFGLLPFQINPHYVDPDPLSIHLGEIREQRIQQFLEENNVAVLGMREGAWLRRRQGELSLGGPSGARLFERGKTPREFEAGDDLSFLLNLNLGFDQPR